MKQISKLPSGPEIRPSLVTGEMVEIINSFNTPAPISQTDIFIRNCRLAGDLIDAYRGRFRTDFLPKLLELTNGVPLLVGHQKMSAPIARFFGGEVIEADVPYQKEPAHFIQPFFYWPMNASFSRDLKVLIDSGIYNEASISFQFSRPTCSVCGKDIRGCPHLSKLYAGDPEVYYYYDEVKSVLEGSIVYKGAEPGTRFDLCYLDERPGFFNPPGLQARAHQ